ncbi:hypothetical protein Tco_0357414 [Tanacetum coccineum]
MILDSEVEEMKQSDVVPSHFLITDLQVHSSSIGPSYLWNANAVYAESLLSFKDKNMKLKDAAADWLFLAVTGSAALTSAIRNLLSSCLIALSTFAVVFLGKPTDESNPAVRSSVSDLKCNPILGDLARSPVMDMKQSSKITSLVGNISNWVVKIAFISGEIGKEEVYVNQTKGFEDPYFQKHVYKSGNALYGLHRAPRALDMQVYVDDIIFLGSTIKPGVMEFEKIDDKVSLNMECSWDERDVSSRTAKTPYDAAKTKLKVETDPPSENLKKSTTGWMSISGKKKVNSWQCKKQGTLGLHPHLRDRSILMLVVILPAASLVSAGSSMFLLVVIPPAASLVSAGSSMFLLVVILPAASLVSAGWSMVLLVVIFPAARLVSAGSSMFLLVVIPPAASLVSAGSSMFLLIVILPAASLVSAGWSMVLLVVIFPAARLVSAGCTMVLLEVIVPAGFFVPAGSYGLCCW